MNYAMKNLKIIPESEAVIPITKREIFSSFGVYESIKIKNGIVEFSSEHISRLFESAVILKLSHNFKKELIEKSLIKLADINKTVDGTIKLHIIGGESADLFAYITALPVYPANFYTDGVKVISYTGERTFPHAKSNCLLLNYMAGREAKEKGALDAILIDRHGYALEGSRSNLFAVKGSTLITSEDDVLYGVTRKRILSIADDLGFLIELEKIYLSDIKLGGFDEVFITSTSMGAIPVSKIDGISIGSSFPVTSLINKNLL